jgi:hypothetical protein
LIYNQFYIDTKKILRSVKGQIEKTLILIPYNNIMKQIVIKITHSLSSILSKNSKIDGRLIVLLFLICYFAMIYISSFMMSYVQFWTYLGVPSMSPSFADLRNITEALECYRQGFDPLINNPCDPWNRPMNYPRIWLFLSSLGLDHHHTFILGVFLAALFYACIFFIVITKRLNVGEGFIYGLVLCSPAVMLAVERGNNDLVIFILLCLSILLIQKHRIFPYFLILIASILKLYPILGIFMAIRENKKPFIIITLIITTIFFIYVTYIYQDITLINTVIPKSANISYGSQVLFDGLNSFLMKTPIIGSEGMPEMVLKIFSFLGILIVLVSSYWWAYKNHRLNVLNSEHIDSFRIGAMIYIGTFIIIGNNWDYRLIFLILTLPQLLAWIKTQNALSYYAVFLLIAILFTMYSSFIAVLIGKYLVFPIEELLNWLICAGLIYILLLTLPDWLKTKLRLKNFKGLARGIAPTNHQ